jgi:hypothetical protein
VSVIKIFCRNMCKYDTAGILTGCMLRTFPGTLPDYNFSLDVVQLMHDGSRMMRKEASTVIDRCLYTIYVYLGNIYQCNLHYST